MKTLGNLRIAQINTNSLNCSDPAKMKAKLISIINLNADITVLNDIRLSDKKHLIVNFLRNTERGNFDFYANSTKNSRGVGLIVNKKANLEVSILFKDDNENILITSIKKGENTFVLGAIYGPRQHEDVLFIDNLMNSINPYKNAPVILMGDFNLITSTSVPLIDVIGSESIPNPRNSKKVEALIKSGVLIDIFRNKKGNAKQYTFMGFNKSSSQRSRIDLALCNTYFIKNVKKISHIIINKTLFDHKATILDLGDCEKSKTKGANMSQLNMPLNKSITEFSIYETLMEYATLKTEPDIGNEALDNINSKLSEIRSKLTICSSILSDSVKLNDKLLKIIASDHESKIKCSLNMLISVETIFEQCNFLINPSMLLQIILNNITNNLKSHQSHMGKLNNHLVNLLHNDLSVELNKSPSDPFKIFSLEEQISEIESEKLIAWVKKQESWEILNRERSLKGFCALSKSLSKEVDFNSTIRNTEFDPPREFNSTNEINDHTNRFYSKLFENNDAKCTKTIDEFLSDLNLTEAEFKTLKTPDEMIPDLGKKITIDEIEKSLKTTKGESAPGMDGFSYNFIKMNFQILKTPMLKCFEYWIENECVSENFCFSKIRLIPKKDNLHHIKSWRPIALLSTFYKVFSGIFSNRIKPVADVVNVLPQKAYSSSRNISEANIDLVNTVTAASVHAVPMAVCTLDFRKAFDSVSNLFVIELFKWMNMPAYLIKLLKVCILGKKGFISDLINSNKTFSIGCGFAQGDRPSGIAFGLCVNIAFFRIINHPLFVDATIPLPLGFEGPENLLSNRLAAFADDGNVKMAAVLSNLTLLKKIFSEFEITSGLVTNFEKTAIIPFNANQEFIDAISDHGYRTEYSFTTLGIDYSTDHRDFVKTNEGNLELKVNKVIDYWSKFYLSLIGKVSVAKTFVYSQLAYLCTAWEFSKKFNETIENKIIKFVNSHVKVGKEKIFTNTNTGGLGLFKVSEYANGIRTSFFRRVENNKDMWAQVINNCRGVYSPSKIVQDTTLAEYYCASHSLAQTYNSFVLNYYMLRGHEGENPVYFNNSIRESRQPLVPSDGWNEGNPHRLHNLTIDEITNSANQLLPISELNVKNDLKISKKTYSKISKSTKKIVKNLNKKNAVRQVKMKHLFSSKVKGSKNFRKIFEKKDEKKTKNLKPTRTREKMFNFEHSPDVEKKLYSLWTTSFLNNEVRSYLYKVANNLTKANVHINKFDANVSVLCKNCKNSDIDKREDFNHIYFECPTTKKLLSDAKKIFLEKDMRYDPAVILINDINNDTTWFEKIIAGIVCYVLFSNRNKTTDKIFAMNSQFRKIITASTKVSYWFRVKIGRFVNVEIDPF